MQDFRNLQVWQKAHQLTLDVYRATKRFPDDERFGLTSQLRRSASSIEANLAEGSARGGDADFARFVQIAVGSASETECHLLIAKDLGYLDTDQYDQSSASAQGVKYMLLGLLKSLRTG
jgi:four helix bundle protein